MIKFISIILWLFIIPEIIGLGVLKFSKKEKENVLLAFVIGYIVSFVIFEFFAIPMTFMKFKFTSLRNIWTFIMIVLTILGIKINYKNYKNIFSNNIEKVKKLPRVLTIIFVIIVIFQCFMGFRFMHEDYDDSNFMAKATIARDTNTLYKYDDIGNEYESFPTRHVFSPFPIYTASLSTLIDIHPAILAHTIFPVVFILVAYSVYIMLGNALFKDNNEKALVFLILLSLIYMWGAYSVYTNFVFLLYRVWQGKAIMANVIIPFIWLLFIKYLEDKNLKDYYWFILFITLWGADLLSSMAISLVTLTTAILAAIYTVKNKDKSYLLKSAICFIPSIIYGIIFLIIK